MLNTIQITAGVIVAAVLFLLIVMEGSRLVYKSYRYMRAYGASRRKALKHVIVTHPWRHGGMVVRFEPCVWRFRLSRPGEHMVYLHLGPFTFGAYR